VVAQDEESAVARRLLSLFVGVPEEMLRSIGLIVVLSSQLDHVRMQILEEADQVPVTTSADWSRRRLTEALISAYAEPLFEPLRQQLATWLEEGESLFDFRDDLVHSVGAYETRGDGSQRFIKEHPRSSGIKLQVTAEELDALVMRLSDATHEGVRLRLDTIVLVDGGPKAYADRIKQLEDIHAEQQRSLEEALREVQADRR
jgi:hypothetical protein